MNRQIRVEKILVQLNVSLLLAQSKFNPSKREIRLLSNKFSFLVLMHGVAGAVVYAVSYHPAAAIKLPKRKKNSSCTILHFQQILVLMHGVSELRNPWTDRLKIWHTWLRRWADLVCEISQNSAAQGLAGNMVKCTPRVLFYIFFRRFLARLYRKKYSTISSA